MALIYLTVRGLSYDEKAIMFKDTDCIESKRIFVHLHVMVTCIFLWCLKVCNRTLFGSSDN